MTATIKRTFHKIAMGLIAAAILIVLPVQDINAQDKADAEIVKLLPTFSKQCGTQTIHGNYSYTAGGSVLPGSPLPVPPGPFASIGTVKLDGLGNITEHITNDNFNGMILPAVNYTGTYIVNTDCSGTAFLTGRAPYKFSIADNGKSLYFMLDVPNTVITGTASRQ